MAIQRTKKQSDLEKRLKLLHHQVYGRPSEKLVHQSAEKLTYRNTDSSTTLTINPEQSRRTETPTTKSSVLTTSDTAFLRQDLLKILLFSSLAIGIQTVLFFLMKNGLNINIF
ncbi:hypothetical protein HYS95_00685 [Candidatus Daviesbacteria bacterium]|nr:hypothetical protein [Candidatus Daviesbacteria bacterium]